jgi:hypothetical protein
MAHPRAEALDALDHLACRLLAVAALMSTEQTCFNEDEIFGLNQIFTRSAKEIRQAREKLAILIPAT